MLPARRPYPDELASSAILRCCRQFNITVERLGSLHLGRDGWHPSFLGASPLRELADLFAIPSEDLLWNHSVFPYATALMQAQHWENAIRNAWGDAKAMVGFGAVTQNVTVGLYWRRFCEHCVAQEFERTRESYWHRSHNLPGVLVCLEHNTYLHESDQSARARSSLCRALPHETTGRRLGRGQPPPQLIQIARISVDWMNRAREPGSSIDPVEYRRMALQQGWLSPDRDVNVQALSLALLQRFSKQFFTDAGAPLAVHAGFWAGTMLRPATNRPFTPIRHAVMLCLLSERPPEGVSLDHIPNGPSGSTAAQLDAHYSKLAAAELKRVLRQKLVLTTDEFLSRVGARGVYKHRKAELPQLRSVVRAFRGSAATVKRLRPGKTLFSLERLPKPVS